MKLTKEQKEWFERWTDKEYCLEAVKQNGDSLRYVKEQTPEICLEAVKNCDDAWMYIKDYKLLIE